MLFYLLDSFLQYIMDNFSVLYGPELNSMYFLFHAFYYIIFVMIVDIVLHIIAHLLAIICQV